MLKKLFFAFFAFMIVYASATSQTVGSKVSFSAVDGKYYTGTITDVQAGKYKVKYDGVEFEAWLTKEQFKVTQQTQRLPTTNPSGPKNATTNYKVGDKVDLFWGGRWWPSVVLDVKDGETKTHYIDWSDSYDGWHTNDLVRLKGSNREYVSVPPKDMEMIGGIPKLVGTGWHVLFVYATGTIPTKAPEGVYPNYIFCNNGHWEYLKTRATAGTYTINGNRLNTIMDGSDKLKASYIITWNPAENYIELNDGKLTFRLRYNGKTTC